MEQLSAAVQRDLFTRMRLRIEELERENAGLRSENENLQRPRRKAGGNLMYRTEAARVAARRKTWRESKQRLRDAA